MQQLNARGVILGWTNLTSETDVPTVPDGAILGIIYNTALQLCNQYDVEVSPLLVKNANDSMRVMEQLGCTIIPTQYPKTLPVGTGNQSDGDDEIFYNGDENQ